MQEHNDRAVPTRIRVPNPRAVERCDGVLVHTTPVSQPSDRPLRCARVAAVARDQDGNGLLRDGRIYQLVAEHDRVRERTLEITFLEPGAEAYVVTFG